VKQEPTVDGPRARYREQVRAEIRAHAWDQIAAAGASGLSLKAIAKEMGMSAPALYRYFASRDELLTDLILGAYQELGDVVVAAVTPDAPPDEQLHQVATTLREWALAHPQRYLLLYGTPVPGYSAPPQATTLARRIFAPVVAAFSARQTPPPSATPTGRKRTPRRGAGDSDAGFHRAVILWTRLHGVLSLEVAGHFVGMNLDTPQLYAEEVAASTR
jgi:AcrR family transcriptional regulator